VSGAAGGSRSGIDPASKGGLAENGQRVGSEQVLADDCRLLARPLIKRICAGRNRMDMIGGKLPRTSGVG
jgi:hypothetical protein